MVSGLQSNTENNLSKKTIHYIQVNDTSVEHLTNRIKEELAQENPSELYDPESGLVIVAHVSSMPPDDKSGSKSDNG